MANLLTLRCLFVVKLGFLFLFCKFQIEKKTLIVFKLKITNQCLQPSLSTIVIFLVVCLLLQHDNLLTEP